MEKRPILIVAAMEDIELNYLKTKMFNLRKIENKTCIFYEGEMFDYPIILCYSNIGIINSAVATTLGIEKYNPKAIINEGIAGGYGENIHNGDIVVGTQCINITSMETTKKERGEGSNIDEYRLVTFIHGEENRLITKKADLELIENAKRIKNDLGKVHFGIIGSGDIWNKEADRILNLYDKYEIICEDMESIATYTIANAYDIPVIAIKSISNNEILKEEYDEKMGLNSQKFTESLVRYILQK